MNGNPMLMLALLVLVGLYLYGNCLTIPEHGKLEERCQVDVASFSDGAVTIERVSIETAAGKSAAAPTTARKGRQKCPHANACPTRIADASGAPPRP